MRIRILVALLAVGNLTGQTPTIALSPDPIVECNEAGLGRARILWDAPDAPSTVIRVGALNGPAMNSPASPTGAASTGDWVIPAARLLRLPDLDSDSIARHGWKSLLCGGDRREGERRLSDRAFREDFRQIAGRTGGKRTALAGSRHTAGFLRGCSITGAEPAATVPAGTFRNGSKFRTGGGLEFTTGVIVSGVGIVSRRTDMVSGSSGGFLNGIELDYFPAQNSFFP